MELSQLTISREEEIKEALKDWRDIVKKYQAPCTRTATTQILNTFIPFLAIWVLMYFSLAWSYWITLGLAVVNGFLLIRIFVIQHDCGHQSFLPSSKWNNVVGFICSLFSTIPYKYWSKVHAYHHGHVGQLNDRHIGGIDFLTVAEYKKKSTWGKFAYRVFRTPLVLFIVSPLLYLSITNRFPFIRFSAIKDVQRSQIINNLALIAVYVLLGTLLGWQAFLMVHLPIVATFGAIAFWFFFVQHQHEETYMQWQPNWDFLQAAVQGSTYYKLPKLFQWLSGNIGIHHIHHLNARIPNYMLEKCAVENPIFQKYTTILTFRESLNCIFNKLWDEQNARMITFREFNRLENLQLQDVKAKS